MRRLKTQVGPEYKPITSEYLDYDEVMQKYDQMMDWLAHLYVGTLNMIHYMHDKYYYEAAEMALIDTKVETYFCNRYCRIFTCSRFSVCYQVCEGKSYP